MNLNITSLIEQPIEEEEIVLTIDDSFDCLEAQTEFNLVLEELEAEHVECKTTLEAFAHLKDLVNTVKKMGLTPELIEIAGEQLEQFSPSLSSGEINKINQELDIVVEGLSSEVVDKFKKVSAKLKDSLKRMFSSNKRLSKNLDALMKEKAKFSGDITLVLDKMIVGYDVAVVQGTLQKIPAILKDPVIIPKYDKKEANQISAVESLQTLHARKFKLEDDNTCAIGYDPISQTYVEKESTARYTQSIRSTGITSLKDILALGSAVQASVFNEDISSNYHEIGRKISAAIQSYPDDESEAVTEIYWILADANFTSWLRSYVITNKFALQAIATLSAVK